MWLNKVVAELVHKYLVACVDCASGNDFPAMKNPTGEDVEVLTQRLRRRIHQKVLPLAVQSRKRKEEEHFLWHDFQNLIILARDHVDVIATQNNELGNLLQKIGADAYGHNDRNQNHFAVLPPMRLPCHGRQPV